MAQIQWANAVNGDFATPAHWVGGIAPGPSDDALLEAQGSAPYTVTSYGDVSVDSIQTAANANLLITNSNFEAASGSGSGANAGVVTVSDGTLSLGGTLDNTGQVYIDSAGSPTTLVVAASDLTLSGGGPVFLDFDDLGAQEIIGASATSVLTDVDDRISGAGVLGGGQLTLINEAQGFIEAKGGPLEIDTGTNTIVNAGLIDAEGLPGNQGAPPGAGVIASPVNNTGTLMSDGGGSSLIVNAPVTGSGKALVDGGLLRFNSTFNQFVGFVNTGGVGACVLYLAQSASFTSPIVGFSNDGADSLDLGDIAYGPTTTLSYSGTTGEGVLTVGEGNHTAQLHFNDNYTTFPFVAASDGSGGTLITAAAPTQWASAVDGDFDDAANWSGGAVPGASDEAVLAASGAAFQVDVSSDTTVASLQTAANATLAIDGALFDAAAGTGGFANTGTITGEAQSALVIGGSVNNAGLITVPTVEIAGDTTLTGGGTLAIAASLGDALQSGVSPVFGLTNVDDTLAGAGVLGDSSAGALQFTNQSAGVVDATSATSPLIVQSQSAPIVNDGLIEATGAAGLVLAGTTVDDSGGGTLLAAAGSTLAVGGDIVGGTLKTAGAGSLGVSGGLAELDGGAAAITNEGLFDVGAGQTLQIAGAIVNAGTIALAGASAASVLGVTGAGATLSGSGVLVLGDAESEILARQTDVATTFVNGGTVAGSGFIGGQNLILVNSAVGVVDAAGLGELTVNTPAGSLANAGVLEASGGGTLVIGATSVDQSGGGTVTAAPTGTVILKNGAIAGGAIDADGSGVVEIAPGDFTLDGAAQPISMAGRLDISGDADVSIEGTLSVGGELRLPAFAAPAALVVGAPGVVLDGGGSIYLGDVVGNGIVAAASGATLTNVNTAIRGGGLLGGAGLTLVNEAGGRIVGDSSTALVIETGADTLINAGLIACRGGSVSIGSALDNDGVLLANLGVLTVDAAVTGSGQAEVSDGTLVMLDAFDEDVTFTGRTGVLELADAQSFTTATISRFSRAGGTTLDLRDVTFEEGVTGASFAENPTRNGGVLTVADGALTVQIRFVGDYADETFAVSSDGHGGTAVIALATAIAGFGGEAAAVDASAPGAPAATPSPALPTGRDQATVAT